MAVRAASCWPVPTCGLRPTRGYTRCICVFADDRWTERIGFREIRTHGRQLLLNRQLIELIRRDRNRASVIVWGVGNENEDSDARLAFMRTLAQAAKAADPTRLTAAACLINREKFCIEDRLTEYIDVIGINEYFGWYEPDFSGLKRLLAASAPDQPVIVSETGADALAGHHGAADQFFTEECQARVYQQQIDHLALAPYVCGMTPWLLYDFRSERRQTVFNQGFNRKGLIAQDKKTRKLAFEVLARHYRKLG